MKTWRVWIETDPIAEMEWSDRIDALLDALDARHDIGGPVGSGTGTSLGAVFEVDAPDVRKAADVAIDAFAEAVAVVTEDLPKRPDIRRVEVVPEDFEHGELVGAIDGARALGVSRQRFYQLMDRPGFPRPATRLARGALWRREEIEAFAANRSVTAKPGR